MQRLFLSTFVNKVDKKGRVSVPADFRRALVGQEFQGVVVFRSLQKPALEACSVGHMEQLSDSLETQDLTPEQYELIETTIFGGSVQLPFDGEGRIVLPQHMCEFAGITEEAAFVGKRRTFEIWHPAAHAAYEAAQRDKARSQDISLSKIIAKASMIKGNGRGEAS